MTDPCDEHDSAYHQFFDALDAPDDLEGYYDREVGIVDGSADEILQALLDAGWSLPPVAKEVPTFSSEVG